MAEADENVAGFLAAPEMEVDVLAAPEVDAGDLLEPHSAPQADHQFHDHPIDQDEFSYCLTDEGFLSGNSAKIKDLDTTPFAYLSKIPHLLLCRFIELLPSSSKHFFMKTSKSNYSNVIRLRGIECSRLVSVCHQRGRLRSGTGGLCLSLAHVPEKWVPLVVSLGLTYIFINRTLLTELRFVKKHKTLKMYCTDVVGSVFVDYTKALVHPGLQVFAVVFKYQRYYGIEQENLDPFTVADINSFLDSFKICDKLTVFQFGHMHFLTYFKLSIHYWKLALEAFYERHTATLKLCKIEFSGKIFAFNDTVLTFVKQMSDGSFVLITEYSPDTVLEPNNLDVGGV